MCSLQSTGTFPTIFITQAVLLLRPNVPLFSTDALPINCSPYSSDREKPTPQAPPRTCECPTQTLCCHGCGTCVGYMIVIPVSPSSSSNDHATQQRTHVQCSRYTSSVTTTNRATNGHRFVFHSNEILSFERRYIAGEPGIMSVDSCPSIPASPTLHPIYPPPSILPWYHAWPGLPPQAIPLHHYQPVQPHLPASAPMSASASPRSDHLPAPLEPAELSPTDSFSSSFLLAVPPLQNRLSPSYTLLQSQPYASSETSPHAYSYFHPQSQSQSPPSPYPDQKDPPPLKTLREGDALYWHHLSRTGEIPEVEKDCKARDRWRDRAWVFDR